MRRLSPQSLPPLLSRLRRHASAHALPQGISSRILSPSRVYASDGAPVAARACSSNRPHLYVAMDDWKYGFSLHKLSLDDLLGGGDACMEPQPLPEPLFRLPFLTVGTSPRFHTLGTNVVVTGRFDDCYGLISDCDDRGGLTIVYDTDTAALDTQHSLPVELLSSYDAVAAGDKLYTFKPCSNGGMLYLCQTEHGICQYGRRSPYDDEDDVPYYLRPQQRWTWKSGPAPPRPMSTHGEGEHNYISAQAVHPDGRTIFVSVKNATYGNHLGTFSLDMESGAWMCHGDWCLPFKGLAHYDGDLGARVGARTVDHKEDYSSHPHLCSCDVPTVGVSGCSPAPAPAWKVTEEKLTFIEAPLKSIYHRVLVPMRCTGGGAGGMFCLVERTLRQGVSSYRRSIGDGDSWVLHVTMFRAMYGKSGELVAVPLLPGRSYIMSQYLHNHEMSAFWI